MTSISAEGRYGVEDTRHAVHEARRQGPDLFCIAIDTKAGAPLSHRLGGGLRPSTAPRSRLRACPGSTHA